MFAPKVAKPQARAAPHRSMLAARPFRGSAVEQAHLLQRTIGNQATLRLLAVLDSGLMATKAGDDRERDVAALKSGEAQEAHHSPSWNFSKIPLFQPDTINGPQASHPLPRITQPKLAVGEANDPLEREANRVADHVMGIRDPELFVSTPPQFSRKCAACEDEEKLQRNSSSLPLAIVHNLFAPGGQASDGATRVDSQPVRSDAGRADTAETPLDDQPLGDDVDLAQELTGGTAPSPTTDVAETPNCCRWSSFQKSDDSYADKPGDTRKNIKFTFTVNRVEVASDPTKCVLVNWIQGTAKNKDGTFRKVTMFDKIVDYNFPTMRIDSIDKDPVYWSNTTARWNYGAEGTGYFATDSPGPTTWVDGIDYDLKFKMCLYCIDDVSATSDETGSGVKNALKCIDWVFKAKYDAATDTFTH